jgi:hypothetical protein
MSSVIVNRRYTPFVVSDSKFSLKIRIFYPVSLFIEGD